MCLNGDIGSCVHLSDADAIGYRKRLYILMTAAGFNVDMVGNYNYGYGDGTFDSNNAGFDGIRDNELAEVMETGYTSHFGQVTPGPFLNSYHTDMVLLHIGTNDILADDYNSAADVERILDAIDDYEAAYGKPVLVFLARIISRRNQPCNTDFKVSTFNNKLTTMAQSRISSGDHLVLVDMECGAGIDYYSDLIDQVHPNQTGYDKMGEKWFSAINSYNTAPAVSQIPDQTRDRGVAFAQISLDSYVMDSEDQPQDMNWSVYPSSPQHFNISIDGNRVATVTPEDPHWSGSESIEFVATDNGRVIEGLAKSDNTIVLFTVNWVPEISGQVPLSTQEDHTITLSLNDITIVEPEKAPGPVDLFIMPGSNYTYNGLTITPAANFNGQLTVPVRIRVNGRYSNPYNLTINVTPVNDIPVITGQATELSTKQDSCIQITFSALEVTDVDDTYPGDFTLHVLPGSNYTVSQTTVYPYPAFYGILSVNVRVRDGQAYSNTYLLAVEVLSINPVIILPDNLDAIQDVEYSESVGISHFNPESFSFSAEELPSWLNFNPGTRLLSGTPANDDVGDNQVTLMVTNGTISADTTFMIHVNNVNDPPFITSMPVVVAHTGQAYRYQMEVTDIDPGEVLTYSATQKPAWLFVNSSTGLVYGSPGKDDIGTHEVTLVVSDGELEDFQSFSLDVLYYNFPPEILTVPKDSATVSMLYTYGMQASDNDNDPLTYFAQQLPDWLSFFTSTRVLIGAPGSQDLGDNLVILGVTDQTDTTFQAFYIHVNFAVSTRMSEKDLDHRVYPNPVQHELFIDLDLETAGLREVIFELYDMTGKSMFRESCSTSKNSFQLQGRGLSDGVYLYRIYGPENGKVLFTGKVILRLSGR
jgi:lysophospholipase L1-like esterase